MGSKPREYLFEVHADTGLSDAAIPVAATNRRERRDGKMVTRHAAMRVRREKQDDPTSPLVYDTDEPVYFDHAIGKSAQFLLRKDGGQKQLTRYTWYRIEFKAAKRERRIGKDDFLVWAEFPYANGWVNAARFKPDSPEPAIATHRAMRVLGLLMPLIQIPHIVMR